MEVELGNNVNKLKELLTAIDNVETGHSSEVLIIGSEYSITLNRDDISIQTNVSMNGFLNHSDEGLPAMLVDEHIHLDQNEIAGCGLDDFRLLLLSWGKFSQT